MYRYNQICRGSRVENAISVFSEDGISGQVKFSRNGSSTFIDVFIKGLSDGKHGFHVHEKGDLTQGCDSACDHYNPTNVLHGDINTGHVGDLGNIVSQGGICKQRLIAPRIYLNGPRSVIGRMLIIHENEDDLGKGSHAESSTTGNSGPRIACAVIGIA